MIFHILFPPLYLVFKFIYFIHRHKIILTSLTATEILNYYHELWKIEESFRCMKSTLEVRPIFHWTERRIKGHFVMCFIAFLLERALEIELKRKGLSISSDRIRQAINTMNYVELEVDERKVYIKTKLTNEAKKILKAVGMKAPANIISEDEVTS
ncbi:IS1634 family transposase [Thermodesulfovibrio sp. TK110]